MKKFFWALLTVLLLTAMVSFYMGNAALAEDYVSVTFDPNGGTLNSVDRKSVV